MQVDDEAQAITVVVKEGGVNVPWSAVEGEEGRKKVLGWQVLLVSIRLREPHMSPDRACVRPFHCSPTLATDVSTHHTHHTHDTTTLENMYSRSSEGCSQDHSSAPTGAGSNGRPHCA